MSKDEENNKDFEKIFTEIVSSDQLKDIQEDFETRVKFGIKELMLVQQSLSDVLSHVSEMVIESLATGDLIFSDDNVYHNLLSSLYKIAEDFNECMEEYYISKIDDDDDDDEFYDEGFEDE